MENHGGTPSAPRRVLFLVDNRPLRRAQLRSFLMVFAKAHDLSIVELTIPEQLGEDQTPGGGLCIINVGSWSSEREFLLRLEALCRADTSRRVVVFSNISNAKFVKASFQAGCNGVIPTSTHPDIAQRALEFVLYGGSYIPPSALDDEDSNHIPGLNQDRPHSKLAPPDRQTGTNGDAKSRSHEDGSGKMESAVKVSADIASLTPRQSTVLNHLRKARSNKEIARHLDMSEATVKLHIRQIMRKLGAKNRTDAALIASQVEANIDPQGLEAIEPGLPGYCDPVISARDVKRGKEVIRPVPDSLPSLKMVRVSP